MIRLAFIATSLLALLLPLIGAGQCQFHRTYDVQGGNDGARSVVATSDGNFAICGSSTQNPYSAQLTAKMTECGDTLWAALANLSSLGGEAGNAIVEAWDGDLVIAGSIYDSIEGSADSYLHKISADGDSVWFYQYDYGYNDRFQEMLQTPDSGFILAGFRNVNADSSVFIVKTDKDGNEEWVTYYGGPEFDYPHDIGLTSDGGYVISGAFESTPTTVDWYLAKFDSAGTELWTRVYDSGHPDDWARVVELPNRGFLLAGGREKTKHTQHI